MTSDGISRNGNPYFTLVIGLMIGLTMACRRSQGGISMLETERSHDHSGGYSIIYPHGWERRGLNQAYGPVSGVSEFRDSVVVSAVVLPRPTEFQEFIEWNLAESKEIPDFKILEQGQGVMDGHECRWAVSSYRFGGVEGIPVKFMSYFLMNQRRGYAITCGTAAGRFDQQRGNFEKIVRTFRFEE